MTCWCEGFLVSHTDPHPGPAGWCASSFGGVLERICSTAAPVEFEYGGRIPWVQQGHTNTGVGWREKGRKSHSTLKTISVKGVYRTLISVKSFTSFSPQERFLHLFLRPFAPSYIRRQWFLCSAGSVSITCLWREACLVPKGNDQRQLPWWPGSKGFGNELANQSESYSSPKWNQKLLNYSNPCTSQVMLLQAFSWLAFLPGSSSAAVPSVHVPNEDPWCPHPQHPCEFSQVLGFIPQRYQPVQTFFTCSDHFSSLGTHTSMPLPN